MIHYNFIGWCQEDKSDKVWVCIQLSGDRWSGKFATIWGRRGKKLQYKVVAASGLEMEKLADSKYKKGYQKIDQTELDRVYPDFKGDLEKTAVWAVLKS